MEWYAKEIGLAYDTQMIDFGKGDNKKPAFLKINPFGKLPAIQTESGVPVFESGAILLYLADEYGGLKTSEERATAAQWVLFANATLSPAMFNSAQRSTAMPALFAALENVLADKTFITGDKFSVADVAVGAYLAYYGFFFPGEAARDMRAVKNVAAYLDRIKARKAFAETIGSE